MKFKFKIKKQVQISNKIVEEKINNYLKKYNYRVVERGADFIIFIEDESSDRKRYRSDYHTKLEEGNFEFKMIGEECYIRLTYLTPVGYPIFLIVLFSAIGVYINSLGPIILSSAFSLPVFYKIYYLNEHVFYDIFQ